MKSQLWNNIPSKYYKLKLTHGGCEWQLMDFRFIYMLTLDGPNLCYDIIRNKAIFIRFANLKIYVKKIGQAEILLPTCLPVYVLTLIR